MSCLLIIFEKSWRKIKQMLMRTNAVAMPWEANRSSEFFFCVFAVCVRKFRAKYFNGKSPKNTRPTRVIFQQKITVEPTFLKLMSKQDMQQQRTTYAINSINHRLEWQKPPKFQVIHLPWSTAHKHTSHTVHKKLRTQRWQFPGLRENVAVHYLTTGGPWERGRKRG